MTQASLSTDRPSPARPPAPEASRSGDDLISSEGALWFFGVTAATLVFASLLMVGLLTQQAIEDAGLNGFLFAVAVGLAGVGLVAFAYVMSLARRAGYLSTDDAATTAEPSPKVTRSKTAAENEGLRVAPTVTAGIGVAKRRERAQQQVARSRQATAIAAASMTPTQARPSPAPRAAFQASTPRPAARPQAARPQQIRRPAPPRLRLPAPSVRPRTNAAMFQASVGAVRAGSFPTPMRPLPPSAYGRP